MKMPRHSLSARLMGLFALLLIVFTLTIGLLYNALMRRQMMNHYNKTLQRNAYAISQNVSSLLLPRYGNLDENRFLVSEDTLAPYMALIEQVTGCNAYLIDAGHNVTGYFEGVVQTLSRQLLPGYIEQAVALGFMGKTPVVQSRGKGDVHLAACAPVMNEQGRVLSVVLLETTLRELGFAQVSSATILLVSASISFGLSVLLAFLLSRAFARPISKVQKVALALADGRYETRTDISQNDEVGSLAHSMDILALRLEEARNLNERMQSQQRAFFSNVSHELKTPVTVIRGSLEALSDGVVSSPDAVQAYYAQMIAESRWLQRLILDLLELSRLQNLEFSLEKETVHLRDLLGDVAMSASALCERKGVLFRCEEPRRDFTLEGDYTRLRQMLMTVLDNAVKFTPPGHAVSIRMDGDRPVISVEDEGIGIPAEEIEHIFERYHRGGANSRESTGLGLTIAREIARRHGVEIRVHSEENAGTTFSFAFPAR